MGVNIQRTMLIAALLSGGIAGLAGVGEVAGIHFHLIDALSNGLGYTGIIAATLGGLTPLVPDWQRSFLACWILAHNR